MRFSLSPTIGYDAKVREANVKFRATLGRFDFDTPLEVVEAAVDAIRAGGANHHYASPASAPELVESIRKYVKEWAGFEPEFVIPSPAKYGVFSVIFILSKLRESKIGMRDVCWPTYGAIAEMSGTEAVPLPCDGDNGFKIGRAYERALGSLGSKDALLVNSPHNPTGLVMDEKELEIIKGFDGYVIADDVYHELDHSGRKPLSACLDPEKLVIVDSLSKSFSMDGWRLGYIATNDEELATAFNKMRSQTLTSIPLFLQKAMNAAITMKPTLDERVEICKSRLDAMMKGFGGIARALDSKTNGEWSIMMPKAEGAFYLFPQLRHKGEPLSVAGTAKLFEDLLKNDIGVTPGFCFGVGKGEENKGRGSVRISYSNLPVEDMPEFLTRFARTLEGAGYANTKLGLEEELAGIAGSGGQ